MCQQGVGVLPTKLIVDAARRLRVSQDIEYEMDRFGAALEEEVKKYKYVERPRGRPAELAEVAVDSLARLCLGLKDGEEVPAEDVQMMEDAVCGGLMGTGPQFRELVKAALASRGERATTYV
jgi:hypothetical protein